MTIYCDALEFSAGTCADCGARGKLIGGCCRPCHEYRLKYHVARPARLWQTAAPAWEVFHPEQAGPNDPIWCDCGKPALWTLTVPTAQRGKTTLLLCDDCAALEQRLALTHSWAGS